jgi:hypothetical protein
MDGCHIFLCYFFCDSLKVPVPPVFDFAEIRYSNFKHFRIGRVCAKIVSALAQPAIKWFPRLFVSNEIRSMYAQLILNDGFETGYGFSVF